MHPRSRALGSILRTGSVFGVRLGPEPAAGSLMVSALVLGLLDGGSQGVCLYGRVLYLRFVSVRLSL